MAKKKAQNNNSAQYNQLLAEYKKLAKRADQRMVRLEKLAQTDPLYKGALGYSYASAKKAAEHWGSTGALPRFNVKAPSDIKQLQAKITDIKQFLGSKTSTKKDIKKTYQDRTKTLNERWGTNFSWQQMADLLNKGLLEWADAMYGSKTTMRAIDIIRENKITKSNADTKLDKLRQSLEEDKTTKYEFDDVEALVVEQLVNQGLDYNKLF